MKATINNIYIYWVLVTPVLSSNFSYMNVFILIFYNMIIVLLFWNNILTFYEENKGGCGRVV
jgi:hypothetical protein